MEGTKTNRLLTVRKAKRRNPLFSRVCGIRRSIMHPSIGNRHISLMTGPFWLSFVDSTAEPRIVASWTRPKGMLKRMVWNLSKPKSLMMREPNIPIPPLGILFHVNLVRHEAAH